jgi:uncharacterized protein (DUF885 family)
MMGASLLPAQQQQSASQQLAAFIETMPGRRYDATEPRDLSSTYFGTQLKATKERLAKLRQIDTTKLTPAERIDWKFAQSLLMGAEIDQERIQSWKRDPQVYLPFRGIAASLLRPGDLTQKTDTVLKAVEIIPTQLANGKKNLAVYVPRFQELGLFMAEGSQGLFEKDIPAFAATNPRKAQLLAANAKAKAALQDYLSFLKNDLPKRPKAGWAIGRETYDLMLKHQYMIPYDADSLYKFGWEQFNKTVAEMEQVAKRIDPKKTWQQICVEVKNEYPKPHEMIEQHQVWVNKARDHIRKNELVPIPWKERVDVVPRAVYLRKTSYYGNFSGARGADKDGTFVGQWQINPFEDQWDEKTKNEYLVEHDWGVIIVTAPHETYAGHHVQGLYQLHNPSKLRRTNGISIFSEGWGLYNEQLMRETGFYPNDRILLRQLQLRLWRNARVVWDVGVHTGKMSYEEAISLLSDKVGFLRWAAQLEVDGSAIQGGYKIGYFMGMSEILKMREEYRKKKGAQFKLAEFHEQLLKVGNMPPALMREGLMLALQQN